MRDAPLLCSMCLLGVRCRYDGEGKPHEVATPILRDLVRRGLAIPVCPEQLGGLPTPRPAAQISGGDGSDVIGGRARVITVHGDDVTSAFVRGAHEALRLAKMAGCREAVLKSNSPSCGAGTDCRHDGSCRAILGVTAALLKQEGVLVRDEHSLLDGIPPVHGDPT